MATDFDLLDSVYPLPPKELYRQWALTPVAADQPADWQSQTLRGWTLTAHRDAHVCCMESRDGKPLGWILEPMLQVRPEAVGRPTQKVTLPLMADAVTEAAVEKSLFGRDADGQSDGTGFEGMWIAIVIANGLRRLYPGPIHSVVYDPAKRRVATSHNLLQPFERDLELSRDFDPIETNRFYSFGLTPFRGVERLLPNHYLDLESFTAVRHWPKSRASLQAGPDGAAAMVEHSRRIVGGLAETAPLIEVPLSAGKDSRAVLSILRPVVAAGQPPVRLFTSVGVDFGKRIDAQGARRLAKIAGLPIEVRQRQKHEAAPIQMLMRNFARIGEAKSGPSLSNPKLLAPAEPERPPESRPLLLAGMAGETGRAFYWYGGAPARLEAADLLRRVEAPVTPRTIAAAQTWIDGLPDFVRNSPADALDLAYVEQRLGCWEANSRYLHPGRPNVVSVMASGFCIETMLRLPPDYRHSGNLQRDMIAYAWPELLAVPINSATGMLFVEQKARGVVRRVRRLLEPSG